MFMNNGIVSRDNGLFIFGVGVGLLISAGILLATAFVTSARPECEKNLPRSQSCVFVWVTPEQLEKLKTK